ncbi:cupin-like domain-containing protein [Streptomyces sp. NRRL WC-3742]|uniref:cupin-like domain-containing protein n=1 Tax=Streptomyces sp. NRRL WC-3742 TaxID=1463934 RepID=UPI0004CC8E5F|nr:cupin-like domain-containing protein [Streptomyces sp. NRRL WC-3742]
MTGTHRIRTVSKDALPWLARAVAAAQPVKLRGLTDGWAASRWTLDGLAAEAGDRVVTVMTDLPAAGGNLPGGQDRYESQMPFAEFTDLIRSPDRAAPCYLGYARPEELFRDYHAAFDFTALTGPGEEPTDTRLWIGSADTCSGLHSDLKDNIFVQVHGRKRVVLVPFAQTPYVYPFLDNIVNSRVDPENVDPAAFPRFARADVLTTVMEPGDALFIPRGWWHYIRSESASISINHWFGPQITAPQFLRLLVRLGPRYLGRTAVDAFRYSVLGRTYRRDFFFTPASTGERLYNLIRHGDFSRENNPSHDS